MKILHNVSPQQISWVKSNKDRLEKNTSIANLYYPETTSELLDLLHNFRNSNQVFDIIGHSSNTLFLPSYKCDNLICTKELKSWHETDETIVCDCGVNVANLSKQMVAKGYVGFEGLTDLPGTIAAGVYGNCGCRGCSVNGLVQSFQLLLPDGSIKVIGFYRYCLFLIGQKVKVVIGKRCGEILYIHHNAAAEYGRNKFYR